MVPPRTLLLAALCFVPSFATSPFAAWAADAPPALKEFKNEAGRFSVLFPGEPQASKEQEAGGITQYQFEIDRPDGTYLLSYQDSPELKDLELDVLRKRLIAGQEGVRNGFRGNLLTSKPLTLAEKYAGLDYACDMPDAGGVYRSRSYLVDGRIYQVIAVGTKDFTTSPEADQYLGSFKLLK
jgi:hypothetical protein